MGRDIEQELAKAGYKMLGKDDEIEDLILAILKEEDARYLKAIPFLIDSYDTDLEKIHSKTSKKKLFGQILAITKKIFEKDGIDKKIPLFDEKITLNEKEFIEEYEMQKLASKRPKLMIEKQKIYAERDLQMQLSILFTKKERQMIQRLLEDKPVSRTDYEYYSRKTRKKLNSIINLYDFAKTIHLKTPKYDEDLFLIKRFLEEWIENNKKYEKVSIKTIKVINGNIHITFMDDTDSGNSIIIPISKIKEVSDLLNKYKDVDF